MFGIADIKELILLMRQSDKHFQQLIKEIHTTNKLLSDILVEMKPNKKDKIK